MKENPSLLETIHFWGTSIRKTLQKIDFYTVSLEKKIPNRQKFYCNHGLITQQKLKYYSAIMGIKTLQFLLYHSHRQSPIEALKDEQDEGGISINIMSLVSILFRQQWH